MLQIARSFVPGGLAGWIIWPKPEPLAALEDTVEVRGRIASDGSVVTELDEDDVRAKLRHLSQQGIEALSISLINAYANPDHERRVGEIAAEELPDIPVSLSSSVLPELREYERTITTVVNAAVQPHVARYVANLDAKLTSAGIHGKLCILRSDGGLVSAGVAAANPVNMLMSGPAGGVTGATWAAEQAELRGLPHLRHGRHVDRRGARAGPQAADRPGDDGRRPQGAGHLCRRAHRRCRRRLDRARPPADPGAARRPAVRRCRAGTRVVRRRWRRADGHRRQRRPRLPAHAARRRGDHARPRRGHAAVKSIADATGLESVEAAAAGIIDIVNENMFGALRLVSVQQGFDPRDFALVAFGGAGPLHANALGKLTGAWPVIIPPSPGVLNAYGDATTVMRDEAVRTLVRRFSELDDDSLQGDPHRAGRRREGDAHQRGRARGPAASGLLGRPALPRPGLRDPGDDRHRCLRRQPAAVSRACARPSTPSTTSCSPSCSTPSTSS